MNGATPMRFSGLVSFEPGGQPPRAGLGTLRQIGVLLSFVAVLTIGCGARTEPAGGEEETAANSTDSGLERAEEESTSTAPLSENSVPEEVTRLIAERRHWEAREVLDDLLKDHPRRSDLWILKGRACVGIGDKKGAKRAFGRAYRHGGESVRERVSRSVVDEFKATIEPMYLDDHAIKKGNLHRLLTCLSFVTVTDHRNELVEWGFDFLVRQPYQDPKWYKEFKGAFQSWLDAEDEVVDRVFAEAVARLARRSKGWPDFADATRELLPFVKPESVRALIREAFDSFLTEPDRASYTMEDMRRLGRAMARYDLDYAKYPEGAGLKEIRGAIYPVYIQVYPELDAWGTPFLMVSTDTTYLVVSAGADRTFEREYSIPYFSSIRKTPGFDSDIVYLNNGFVQYPNEFKP